MELSEPWSDRVVMQSVGSFVTFDPFFCAMRRRLRFPGHRDGGGVMEVTCISGVDAEALVPEAAQQDEAVVSRDDETLSVDLDTLI